MVTSMIVSLSGLATALPVESTNTIGLDEGNNPGAAVLCALADPFTMNATAMLAAIMDDIMSGHLLDTAKMLTGPRGPRQVGHQRPFRRRTTSRSRMSI